jgi:DNA modification methylase
MKIEQVKLEALIPYARNSRTHSDGQVAQIAASIKEFGFTNPVLIDETGSIIAGHGRVMAARKLGLADVPSIRLTHLTEAQKRAYIIADNKLALNAGWDDEMLAVELTDLKDMGFDLDLTGFSAEEIDGLLAPMGTEGLTEEDAVPEVPEAPVTVLGDVWLLGKHRVMCGDSTSIDAVDTLMDGGKADMVFTDPPYNVAVVGGCKNPLNPMYQSGKAIENDSMSDADFRQFLRDAFASMDAGSKDGAVAYVCHADSEGINFRCAFVESGWMVKQCLIWRKSAFVFGRQDYHWQHEPILYGWKQGNAHKFYGERNQSTVWDFNRPAPSDKSHPTMKPVELVEKAINNSSKAGDLVLDIFGGSGSTMIACEKTGRECRLMELDPKYCDVIVKRWQEFTGKIATHAETGRPFAEVTHDK